MCTLTAGRCDAAVRVVVNRDEAVGRAEATPPRLVDTAGGRAVMPTDSPAGGTWIAANDRGMILALLNRNPPGTPTGPAPGAPSRGELILRLLDRKNPHEAACQLAAVASDRLAPFRLILLNAHGWASCLGGGGQPLTHASHRWVGSPLMWTSSGLGDHRVQAPRRALFEGFVAQGWAPQRQDAFHHHRWPDRPDISIHMRRADARTVSITTILVGDDAIQMRYAATRTGVEHTARLPRSAAAYA